MPVRSLALPPARRLLAIMLISRYEKHEGINSSKKKKKKS